MLSEGLAKAGNAEFENVAGTFLEACIGVDAIDDVISCNDQDTPYAFLAPPPARVAFSALTAATIVAGRRCVFRPDPGCVSQIMALLRSRCASAEYSGHRSTLSARAR
jgi:hypothetical protein